MPSDDELRRILREELVSMPASQRLSLEAQVGAEIIQRSGPPGDSISYYHEQIADAGVMLRGVPGDTVLLNDVSAVYRAARWAHYGFNVFQLTHSLAAGLIMTEPADLNEPPNMPFPCFCITIPEGIIPFWHKGEQHWAEHVWLHRYSAISRETGEEAIMYRWCVDYRGVILWRLRKEGMLTARENDTFHFWIPGQDEKPVEEDLITEEASLRLVLNVCSWLSSVGGLQDKHKSFRAKNKAKKKTKNRKPGPLTWVLGREVKLDKAIREAATDSVLGRSRKPRDGWKQRVQTIVRGHFQHYWVGSGEDKKRIHKWKECYVKNKDANIAYSHLYTDKG